jgi:enterochelin esterase-like enzyme
MIKRLLRTYLILLLAVLSAAGCGGKGQLVEETVPAPSLRENVLGDPAEQPIVVYLPPSYASANARFPVVYVLPGYNSYVGEFIDGSFQGFNLLEAMDRLTRGGTVGDMIVVVVNGRNVLGGSGYVNSSVTGRWEDFVAEDVVRHVDTNYKTLPYKESRGIAGHSLGGFGALNIAMRRPDVFDAVYALSPGLFAKDGFLMSGIFGNNESIEEVLQKQRELAALSREDAHDAFISLIEGLFASGRRTDILRAIRYAYGTAFSPDPEANAPYIVYPYNTSGGGSSMNMSVWNKWESGFGGIEHEVSTYRDNLLQLDGIGIDVGLQEENQWLLAGCRHFAATLDAADVPHELVTFEGGHGDRLRERIEQHMLPFFSNVLKFE